MKRDIQRSNRNRGRMPARRGGRRPQRHNEDRGERRGNRFNRGRRSNNNQPRRRFRNAERPQRFRGGKGRRLGKKKTPTAEQLDNDLDNYYKKAGKGENCKIQYLIFNLDKDYLDNDLESYRKEGEKQLNKKDGDAPKEAEKTTTAK